MQFEIQRTFPTTPERLYNAWLNSEQHGAMTGGEANIDPRVGGVFTAWDDYISGTTLELDENSRIVQSWRTAEFKDEDGDSRLELNFVEVPEGTMLTLKHISIPEGQPDYEQGWIDNYFVPMEGYFDGNAVLT